MVLNSKMETASLTSPSPNKIELSLGNCFSFIKLNGATVSVDERITASSIQSNIVKSTP